MSENEVSVRFELIKNGERQAIGGVEYGMMNFHAVRIARDPQNIPADLLQDENFDREQYLRGEFGIHFTSMPGNFEETHYFIEDQPLAVGDEIILRILGPGQVDEPVRRANTFKDTPRTEHTDYAAELRDAEAAYDAAIDGLLSALSLPRNEFTQLINKLPSSLRRYKQALQAAIKASEGEEKDEYQFIYNSLRRFPAQLLALLSSHRNRTGIDTGEDKD